MYFRPINSHQHDSGHGRHNCEARDRCSPQNDPKICSSMLPAVGSPRSAAEEYTEDSPKFRQLPCRTFISVGTCPYRERCVYLHDPRLMCRDAKTKTRKKNKEDIIQDSLFWPTLPYDEVSERLDSSRLPHVIQRYGVPAPKGDQYCYHDQAVYSMWMHFVTSCSLDNVINPFENEADMAAFIHPGFYQNPAQLYRDPSFEPTHKPLFLDETLNVNPFINVLRLNIFKKMSLGQSAGPPSGLYRKPVLSRNDPTTPTRQASRYSSAPYADEFHADPLQVQIMQPSKLNYVRATLQGSPRLYGSDECGRDATQGPTQGLQGQGYMAFPAIGEMSHRNVYPSQAGVMSRYSVQRQGQMQGPSHVQGLGQGLAQSLGQGQQMGSGQMGSGMGGQGQGQNPRRDTQKPKYKVYNPEETIFDARPAYPVFEEDLSSTYCGTSKGNAASPISVRDRKSPSPTVRNDRDILPYRTELLPGVPMRNRVREQEKVRDFNDMTYQPSNQLNGLNGSWSLGTTTPQEELSDVPYLDELIAPFWQQNVPPSDEKNVPTPSSYFLRVLY